MTDIHYRRSFADGLELRDDDGRPSVSGRIVPIGVEAEICEPGPDGELQSYRETFLPGCSTRARQKAARLGSPGWVGLKLGHSETLDRQIGWATALDERPDGLYATFGLYEGADLDKVRSMLREAYRGLSIEFSDAVPPVTGDGLVARRSIHLHGVAATPIPAYAGAVITAVRSLDAGDDGTPRLDAARALLAELRALASA